MWPTTLSTTFFVLFIQCFLHTVQTISNSRCLLILVNVVAMHKGVKGIMIYMDMSALNTVLHPSPFLHTAAEIDTLMSDDFISGVSSKV